MAALYRGPVAVADPVIAKRWWPCVALALGSFMEG
jgi:hypothetical protein